ncbi:MAG: tetratricopeptide repeat protein [Phycisphaeraceae bacterium]|nr:tetratricopeptide repeat protein [Phycisphaeraceae bacterium]
MMSTAGADNTTIHRADKTLLHRLLPALVLVVVATGLYLNTLPGPFIFDDEPNISADKSLRDLPQVTQQTMLDMVRLHPGTLRPLTRWTLAVNCAIDGLEPRGYHLFNLLVHAAAGLALFGVVRRTLLLPRWAPHLAAHAHWWAFAVALLWVAHPLNTQAVTYIIQRGESLMAAFFLASMYAAIRQWQSPTSTGRWLWAIACVAAALLATWSKEVAIVLPGVLLAYDWVMLRPGSLKAWLRRRGALTAALCLVSAWLMLRSLGTATQEGSSAGFGLPVVGPFGYLISQSGVILHYLRLAFWPDVLVLDYFWMPAIPHDTPSPYVTTLVMRFVFWQSLAIGGLLIASLIGLIRRQWWAFCGVAFFMILAPTSSVMPIADLAVEHRMYLPLTCVVAIVVIAAGLLIRWIAPSKAAKIGAAILILTTAALGSRTVIRNFDYLSPIHLWDKMVIDRPDNPRAWQNLGALLLADGREDEALFCFERVLSILPNYAAAHAGLGDIYLGRSDAARAIAHYESAVAIDPQSPAFHYDFGRALLVVGQTDKAQQELSKAIELQPIYPRAYNNLGLLYLYQGKLNEAIANLELSISQDPEQPEAYVNLATAYERRGQPDRAVDAIRQAIDAAQRAHDDPQQKEKLDARQQEQRMQKLKARLEELSEKAGPAPASP